ncbi:hypothetical protein GF360_02500 [candidate division WWE3 bacterium]|nr:hypothetical protein [candidate division WWE3 bacterium]
MKKINLINRNILSADFLKKICKISAAIFIGCFIVQFYLSNRYAVKNASLQGCLSQSASLEKDLARLKYRASLLSSLEHIEKKAKEQGFTEMDQNLLTIGPTTVASAASLTNR